MVAINGELLCHVPPAILLDRLIVLFTQTEFGPVITAFAGNGFTVIPADAA